LTYLFTVMYGTFLTHRKPCWMVWENCSATCDTYSSINLFRKEQSLRVRNNVSDTNWILILLEYLLHPVLHISIVTCYLRSQPIRGSMLGNGCDKTMYAALYRWQ
jgi:hypothetical protein